MVYVDINQIHFQIVNEDVFANTSVHESEQLAHSDPFSVFDVQLDMDWLDDISKSNAVIEHNPHEFDEFVSSDPAETLEFYTECVNVDAPGVSARYTVNNEADMNNFGETDEAVFVLSSSFSDSVSWTRNCCFM